MRNGAITLLVTLQPPPRHRDGPVTGAERLAKHNAGLADLTQVEFVETLDVALSEERRLTVERIRERLYEIPHDGKSALYFRAAVEQRILDEVERGPMKGYDDFQQGVHDGLWPDCDVVHPHTHSEGR